MASLQSPRTDIGTVCLHWLLVVALGVATATGLRIAADDQSLWFLSAFDPILPSHNLFLTHVIAGLSLLALMAAYAVYVVRTGLARRVRVDQSRLAGLQKPGRTRWSALNALLTWSLFLALLALGLTGTAIYLGGGAGLMRVHLWATWTVLAFPILHVGVHFAIGGKAQLARIFLPTARIPSPPPSLADLLSEHLAANENVSDPAAAPLTEAATPLSSPVSHAPAPDVSAPPTLAELAATRRLRRTASAEANPLVTAFAAGIGVMIAGGMVEQTTRAHLHVQKIAPLEAPILDGDLSDPAWSRAQPVHVLTQHGANLRGTGQSDIEVRALHDGTYAYLAFVWDDPSRSLKHVPLIKANGAWYVAGDGHERADETTFHDDQFSVLLLDADVTMIGAAIHLSRAALPGLPPSASGRGLHFTGPGGLADVWVWKASRGGLLGYMDNGHFSEPKSPTDEQAAGLRHYSGGFGPDAGTAMAVDNIAPGTRFDTREPVTPLRLPRDYAAMQRAMGRIDPDPDHSEPEGAVWWLTPETSEPYSAAADARLPEGTVIPGVAITGAPTEARAEIAASAKWASGRWTLEVRRRLDTRRPGDVPIRNGVLMWLAVFDHAETRHTWHLRPLRLEVSE